MAAAIGLFTPFSIRKSDAADDAGYAVGSVPAGLAGRLAFLREDPADPKKKQLMLFNLRDKTMSAGRSFPCSRIWFGGWVSTTGQRVLILTSVREGTDDRDLLIEHDEARDVTTRVELHGKMESGLLVMDRRAVFSMRPIVTTFEKFNFDSAPTTHTMPSISEELYSLDFASGKLEKIQVRAGGEKDRMDSYLDISKADVPADAIDFQYSGERKDSGLYGYDFSTSKLDRLRFPRHNLLKDGSYFEISPQTEEALAISPSPNRNEYFDMFEVDSGRYGGKRRTVAKLPTVPQLFFRFYQVLPDRRFAILSSSGILGEHLHSLDANSGELTTLMAIHSDFLAKSHITFLGWIP